MARFRASSFRTVRPPRQAVCINGVYRPRVRCLSITEQYSLNPNECVLSVPDMYAGEFRSWLRGARVVVYAHSTVSPTSVDPVFIGWVETDTSVENKAQSTVELRVQSILHLMDRVFVGQVQRQALVAFLKRSKTTGRANNWKLTTILRTLFSSRGLDSNWRSVVGIGSLRGVEQSQVDVDMPDVLLHTQTYLDALRNILRLVPDVGVRERYESSGKTLLDFFQFGDSSDGARTIRIPDENTGAADGAVVTAWTSRESSAGCYSRAIGYGRPTESMITIGTDHPTAPLFPGWGGASSYEGTIEDWELAYTVDESNVLANPLRATPGTPHFDRDLENTFRRFLLPQALRRYFVLNANVFEYDQPEVWKDGEEQPDFRLPIQVFREKYDFENIEPDGAGTVNGDLSTTEWEIINGWKIDLENWELLLPAPAVAQSGYGRATTGERVDFFIKCHVYITLSIYDRQGPRPTWDTGIRGTMSQTPVNNSGLVFEFFNESVGAAQIGTNTGFLVGENGSTHTFGARWLNPKTLLWEEVEAGSPVTVEDDRLFLASLTERVLAERSRPRVEAEVSLPMFSTSYHVGQPLRLFGRDLGARRFRAVRITRNLVNPETLIFATDQIPLRVPTDRKAPVRRGMSNPQGLQADGAAISPRMLGPAPAATEMPAATGSMSDNAGGIGSPTAFSPEGVATQQGIAAPQGGNAPRIPGDTFDLNSELQGLMRERTPNNERIDAIGRELSARRMEGSQAKPFSPLAGAPTRLPDERGASLADSATGGFIGGADPSIYVNPPANRVGIPEPRTALKFGTDQATGMLRPSGTGFGPQGAPPVLPAPTDTSKIDRNEPPLPDLANPMREPLT